jgi:hypothetical protein
LIPGASRRFHVIQTGCCRFGRDIRGISIKKVSFACCPALPVPLVGLVV